MCNTFPQCFYLKIRVNALSSYLKKIKWYYMRMCSFQTNHHLILFHAVKWWRSGRGKTYGSSIIGMKFGTCIFLGVLNSKMWSIFILFYFYFLRWWKRGEKDQKVKSCLIGIKFGCVYFCFFELISRRWKCWIVTQEFSVIGS